MHHFLERPARRILFSDTSKTPIGGYRLETGVYWRYVLDAGERPHFFCGSRAVVTGKNDISIHVVELLGMVVSAFVLVILRAERARSR